MRKVKKIFEQKYTKIALFMIFDVIGLIISGLFALYLRFDFSTIPDLYFNNMITFIAVDIAIMFIIYQIFELYISVWYYASISELLNVFYSCFFFELTTFAYKTIFNISLPKSAYLIQFMILFMFTCGTRFSFRILRAIIIKFEKKNRSINTMIIGAGDAGRLLIDEIENNSSNFDNRLLCIIDDDKNKVGTKIKKIPVVGTRREIEFYCEKFNIQQIIIAIPSLPKSKIALIVKECQKTKCDIKILPSIFKELNTDVAKIIRPLSYEDFLGRDQIVVDLDEIKDSIFNKTVLVTGGGGSIGSELCRQIAKCNPNRLVIFDIYENNAYDIEQELRRNYPNLNLDVIIGSVRDYDRLEVVFKDYKFDYVFHAAAHKHVPLMEYSPNEAIKNNCLGTLNACKLADKYKVKKFVLISTDKAVRPTNVMGASKRICEMIMQTYANKSKNTEFAAVRFGNVLGSNGSVIPLFLKQIENGGPVTVTDKEITRFFMTIPEAVSLVLQAGYYATGGEIFVLDMGKPVKIYELAKQIIRFKGYEPYEDIDIKITGLRPGEKLYEEVLMDEEGLEDTPNKLIHIGKPLKINYDKFLKELDALIKKSYKNEYDIKDDIAKIVTTYKIDRRK